MESFNIFTYNFCIFYQSCQLYENIYSGLIFGIYNLEKTDQ